jgi:O-acetyl-ADP-ribose deacetylase (regulator of RNase III)
VNSMRLAAENHVKTIAFPSIGTGAYGFPIERAARIAVTTVAECLDSLSVIEKAIFVCFSRTDLEVYERELSLC